MGSLDKGFKDQPDLPYSFVYSGRSTTIMRKLSLGYLVD